MKQQYLRIALIFFVWMGINQSALSNDSVKMRMNWKHQFQFAGYYMAKEKGFYREADIDVDLLEHEGGNKLDVYQELSTGGVQFAAIGPAAVDYFLDGSQIVALGVVFQQTPRAWVSLASKQLNTKEDLMGKRFAFVKRKKLRETGALLQKIGLSTDDIQVLDISYGVEALINDEVDFIDAYISNEVFSLVRRNIIHSEKRPIDYGLDFYGDGLFSNMDLLRKNPDLVERFREASFKGWKYAFENIEETVDVILSKYNDSLQKSREALLFEARQLIRLSSYPSIEIGDMSDERWLRNAMMLNPERHVSENQIKPFLYKSDANTLNRWLVIFALMLVIAGVLVVSFKLTRREKH